MKAIEIFKTGTHTAMNGETQAFGEDILLAMATAYDVSKHEAPFVVGHPKSDSPAYGWVSGLSYSEGSLIATPAQVDPAFSEMVDAGRFKKVSASFYKPDSPANPAPGNFSLRHVGFLGAQPPAVKGLKQIEFAGGDDDTVTIEFGEIEGWTLSRLFRKLREFFIEEFGKEKADEVMPDWMVNEVQDQAAREDDNSFGEDNPTPQPTNPKEDKMSAAEKAAQEAEFSEKEKKLDEDKQALDKDKAAFAEQKRAETATSFVEDQAKAGRVLPAEKDALVQFMVKLDDEDTVQFGEGEDAKQTPLQFFEEFVKTLPDRVDYAEHSAGDGEENDSDDVKSIANNAVAYQEEMRGKGVEVSTTNAVKHVQKGGAS